jgi:ketosteroid isomerase-like protein
MAEGAARALVERFWRAMGTNDWSAAGALLHDEFLLEWPQSGERIRGREAFAAVNAHYPAAGPWRFTVHRIVAEGDRAVSDVGVTDGAVAARAVTFFEVRDGRVWRMTEFWPDPFPPAEWRAPWVEREG